MGYYLYNGNPVQLDNAPLIPLGGGELQPGYTELSPDYYNALTALNTTQAIDKQNPYLVDPNIEAGQAQLAELIKRRGAYIEETSKPYREQLFGTMSYGNPNLESDYFNAAIPQIQKDYRQAADLTGRTAGATGVGFDSIENKLASRLNILGQEQTIASAAKNIKQRLRERDLTTALGTVGATNEVIKGA